MAEDSDSEVVVHSAVAGTQRESVSMLRNEVETFLGTDINLN